MPFSRQFRCAQERRGQGDIPLEFELRMRLESRGVAGMPGYEDEFARMRAREVYFQVVRRSRGLAVLVRPQDREIERPARTLKVIRIAAERRDVRFRGEHEPYVVVAFVFVQKVLASLVQGDGLAFELA
jgi:hypothetical protein